MNKYVKIIIMVALMAAVAYAVYKWMAKRNAAAQAAKKPQVAPVVDRRTGKAIVRDLSNGLDGDLVMVA